MDVHGLTIHDLIERGASLYGEAPRFIQGERSLTFRELPRRVEALAAVAGRSGHRQGRSRRVLAQNDVDYVVLYGACGAPGIIAYPINWRLTAQESGSRGERAAPR